MRLVFDLWSAAFIVYILVAFQLSLLFRFVNSVYNHSQKKKKEKKRVLYIKQG